MKNKRSILKSLSALISMTILLLSSAFFVAIESNSANAQTQSNCKKLPIASVSASGASTGWEAAKAIDNDLSTSWAWTQGAYIQTDLGHSSLLCSMDISWYKGNGRTYNFVISVSQDNTNFVNIVSGKSTGETASAERYNLPDVMARYVRVSVLGNTDNSLSVISEISVNGQGCMIPQISSVTAKGNDGNVPQNTLDNNLGTRWSNLGFPSWIQYDLGESQPICNVDIAWWRGNLRVNTFTISVSNDGINYRHIFSGQSSGKTMGLERYDIPDNMGRYVRITVMGNTENSWSSITEVRINGGAIMECKSPQISGVSAIGNDGNIPQNTLDNNLNTRWSNLGFPSWIQYDLGESQPICNVDIAWWRGNLRVNTFTISVSNDGMNFIPVFSGQSSGKTMGLERYNVSDTMSRYVRITVMGNTENSWSSIGEVRINGGAETPPPSQEICGNGIDDDGDGQIDEGCPSQEICGNGIDDDGDGQIDEGCPSQEICGNGIDDDGDGQIDEGCPPGGGDGQNDRFGIKKIYPTKASGEEWFMDMSDGQDSRSDPPDAMTKNSDGSFKVRDTKVRFGVFTSSGYDSDEVELDHGELAERGYMQSPNDWKNIEMTGYVKVNDDSAEDDENFAFYARGGRHTGDGNPEGCEGSAYKGDLSYDGTSRFAKEQWHVSYVFSDRQGPFADPQADWVGFKTIMWNVVQPNGETVVKMENWVDANEDGNENGPWERIIQVTDDGGWGDEGSECGGEDDQIITWGGPIATFRWDGADDVDIKNLSVREIQAPSQ